MEFFLPCLFKHKNTQHRAPHNGPVHKERKGKCLGKYFHKFTHGIEFPLKLDMIVRVNILKGIHKKNDRLITLENYLEEILLR